MRPVVAANEDGQRTAALGQLYDPSAPLPPICHWFRKRLTWSLVFTLVLPVLCSLTTGFEEGPKMRSIVGSGDAHDDAHGDAHGEAHGEAHGDVEAHHRRAMSSLTLLFEFGQQIIEEKYAKYRSVLAHVWGELTVLGFLALITFMMVQSEVLLAVSELVFGDEMHMVHMFEKIHLSLRFSPFSSSSSPSPSGFSFASPSGGHHRPVRDPHNRVRPTARRAGAGGRSWIRGLP